MNYSKIKIITLTFMSYIFACQNMPMHFKILNQKKLEKVSGASGIIKFNNYYYVIGDDSPYLFKLNSEFNIISEYQVSEIPVDLETGRIPKKDKHDLETLEMISEKEMISFGSGSKSPERDEFIRIIIGNGITVKKYKLTAFYNALKSLEILKDSELNIEAVAHIDGLLYIFNRRKNVIFTVNYKDFLGFIENNSPLPEIKFIEFKLPDTNGIEAGFSGATAWGKSKILVTSSVEDTDNAYDDGEILGSFIGVISVDNNKINKTINWVSIQNENKSLKIESIAVDNENSEKDIDVVLVTDSDGDKSLILKGNLKW